MADYRETSQGGDKDRNPTCPFCNLSPSDIVYESGAFCVIRDIKPRAPDHYLIVPSRHCETPKDLDMHEALDLALSFQGAKHIQLNLGSPYQQVAHIHLHVMGIGLRVPSPSS